MTDLTDDEVDALIRALENGGLFNCGPLPPGPGFLWEYGGHGDWELTPAGTLIANSLKRERDATAWRPIETAPRDGTWVLLWWPYWSARPTPGRFYCDEWVSLVALSKDGPGPTHWLPLPPQPEPV